MVKRRGIADSSLELDAPKPPEKQPTTFIALSDPRGLEDAHKVQAIGRAKRPPRPGLDPRGKSAVPGGAQPNEAYGLTGSVTGTEFPEAALDACQGVADHHGVPAAPVENGTFTDETLKLYLEGVLPRGFMKTVEAFASEPEVAQRLAKLDAATLEREERVLELLCGGNKK